MTYGSNTRKTLRTLQKLFLRPMTIQLPTIYKPFYVTKVYGLISKSLLHGLCMIHYVRRTKRNGLKRKPQTILILMDSLLLKNLIGSLVFQDLQYLRIYYYLEKQDFCHTQRHILNLLSSLPSSLLSNLANSSLPYSRTVLRNALGGWLYQRKSWMRR